MMDSFRPIYVPIVAKPTPIIATPGSLLLLLLFVTMVLGLLLLLLFLWT